ncbi:MAG TPA: squalene--hopene cyclase, partial [Geobacteraceae bacterium]
MKSCKYPISHALTSLNGVAPEADEKPAPKPGAKIHHLPHSIWKKKEGEAHSPLDIAIARSRDFFFREQLPAGYWWAELESNATITAEYIMLFHFLGMVDREKER